MLAINSEVSANSVTVRCIVQWCFGYSRKHNFWFNTEPMHLLYRGPWTWCRNTYIQDILYTVYIILIPCLLVFFISIQRILHELVCDYNKVKVQQLKAFCACVGAHAMHVRVSWPESCSASPSTVLVPVLAIRTAGNCWLPALNVVVAHGAAYRREGVWLFRPCVRLCKVSGVIC